LIPTSCFRETHKSFYLEQKNASCFFLLETITNVQQRSQHKILEEANILNLCEQQYFVWGMASRSTQRQDMLEIWGMASLTLLATPMVWPVLANATKLVFKELLISMHFPKAKTSNQTWCTHGLESREYPFLKKSAL